MLVIRTLTILVYFPLLCVMSTPEDGNLDRLPSLNEHQAVFDQPLTHGNYNFNSEGFIPVEPLIRIRKIHTEMMYTIQSINDHRKQVKYILTLCNTANVDLKKLRHKIETSNLGNYANLNKEALKADVFILAVSHGALIGNAVLYFPDIVSSILQKNKEFDENVKWVIEFASTTNIINDKGLIKLFHLVKQEMGLVERDPDYQNPYKLKKIVLDSTTTTTKKPRKKLKRGPRLSGGEL